MFTAIVLNAAFAAAPAGSTAMRLEVSPMAAPRPLLKYRLLPEVRELTPGNPVQWYLRCFAEQRFFFFSPEGNRERARYLSMPLAKLRVQGPATYGGSALLQADWAARLSAPDWEVVHRLDSEGLDFRQPELEPLRILGAALHARLRIQVARGDFDAAVGTLKTMFALARHLGDCPTSEADLTGIAIAEMASKGIEEMIQQPGCPNLYWALADLPSPLVGLRSGFQGDRVRVDAALTSIRDDRTMTEEEIEEVVSGISGRLDFAREQEGQPPLGLRRELMTRIGDAKRVGRARARLLERAEGKSFQDQVAALRYVAFPPAQIILLDEKQAFEVRRDELLTRLSLSPTSVEKPVDVDLLFDGLLPRVIPARHQQLRVEQCIAMLRHVEAIRLHGKLPQSLEEIAVPLPSDPFTGKPFAFAVRDGVAVLSPPKGESKSAPDRRYTIVFKAAAGGRKSHE